MPNRLPFPSAEAALNTYFQINIPYLIDNANRLNINSANQTTLNQLLVDWNTIYPKSTNANLRTKTITTNKNKIQEELIRFMRKIFRDIPATSFTIKDRTTLNLPQKKGYRSAPPVPSSVPKGAVNINNRLQHTVSFYNTGGSKAKPYLVRGCQIWYKIGSSPTDVKEMSYLITASKSPYTHVFDGKDAGKMVYYWMRWENTQGETGPWSDEVGATIGG